MLWYKNLYAFTLEEEITAQQLSELQPISPAPNTAMFNSGWCSVLSDGLLFQEVSGAYFLALQVDKKSVPSNNVKVEVKKEISRQLENGVEKPNKKEIKEAVVKRLAEGCIFKTSYVRGYIDNKNKLLVVDSTSANDIDLFTSSLRKALGSLKINLFQPDIDIVKEMTSWAAEKSAPSPFILGAECSLIDIETGSATTYKKQDLSSEEISYNLENGKVVSSIRLDWADKLTFVIDDKLQIKSIKTKEFIDEQVEDTIGEDNHEATLFSVAMLIMKENFAELLGDIERVSE
jgi:recombination associated protein RdgC